MPDPDEANLFQASGSSKADTASPTMAESIQQAIAESLKDAMIKQTRLLSSMSEQANRLVKAISDGLRLCRQSYY